MKNQLLKTQQSKISQTPRIAWLLPSMEGGSYWHPLFKEFTQILPDTIIYTGFWSGFAPGYEGSFNVKIVGTTTFVSTTKLEVGYSRGFIRASPAIINHLLRNRPNIIFANGFSVWTILAILLKPFTNWRVIIAVEGSSPNVDYRNSKIRLLMRRYMTKLADGLITNNNAGKTYLTNILNVPKNKIFARPYEVPTSKAMSNYSENIESHSQQAKKFTFLFVGQLIPRKGLHLLLKACNILQQKGCREYKLMVIGQGSSQKELQTLSQEYKLEENIEWIGWVDYNRIGEYFQQADVFILPTLEDTWGMVVLESMSFGKPVLCSKWAGASELVEEGTNGYIFDPHFPEEVADAMYKLLSNPDLTAAMGKKSQQIIAEHNPEAAAKYIADVINLIMN